MARIVNVIVDLQSVVAIGLAAALMVGAFEKVYLNDDLQKNAASTNSKTLTGLTPSACDYLLSDDLEACGSDRFELDPLAFGGMSSP
ncbi:MAG: hypothetical protein PVI91_13010 [Gammaproteobacteria bacterium]|jgi:hypothetical protein